MMGLRLKEGVPLALFDETKQARIVDLCKAGYCEKTLLRLNLTTEGSLRLDSIVACLLADSASLYQETPTVEKADSFKPNERENEH